MKPIIEVKQLGKRYTLTHQKGGYVALRDVIVNVFIHPWRFITSTAKSTLGLARTEAFWALKDITFSANRGEVIGIIGKNGAGKSTLLKILTGITPPTEGEAILRGKVSSLLEVGTGFHPELTGRENIFLNGAILGMTRREIAQKFDDIVAFAGVEQFLDTPVKRYSSGMYVRLAFSVAAHMEPDILIVDEVLAVGDAEFQKKCLGKMEQVAKESGRTIIFVSHNMGAIQRLCTKTILLEQGKVAMMGETKKVVEYYLAHTNTLATMPVLERTDRTGNGDLQVTDCYLSDSEGNKTNQALTGENATLVFEYACKPGKKLSNVIIGASVSDSDGTSLFLCHNQMTKTNFGTLAGKGKLMCTLKHIPLVPGSYYVSFRITADDREVDYLINSLKIEILPGDFYGTGSQLFHSKLLVDQIWSKQELPIA